MTVTPRTISATPSPDPGMDYGVLLTGGLTLLQELAGEIWTEYNESDPGRTTLEQLCYALTELSYRASLPLEDLLVGRPGERIHPRRQALYPALRIFPVNPVTERDYRKLLLDRLPKLGNVWIQPHRPPNGKGVDGLYDVALYVPGLPPPPCTPAEEERQWRERVQRVYNRHRNLCEDLRCITFLRTVRTIVAADVSIDDAPRPETIMAELLFRTSLLLVPEPRRQPLQSLMQRNVEPSAIFNGPLLLNGFIDDEELQPKAASIRVQDVVRTLTRGIGVNSVRNVKVWVREKPYSGNASIPVPRRDVLQLDPAPDAKRGYAIRLFRNGIQVVPDPARVTRELDRLWAEQRRTYRLSAQYDEYFGFPSGQWRDLREYYSIQNQFPDAYGINEYGLPADALPAREAAARQFKGYLLVYEQLLADYFAQLAHARDLYSTEAGLERTYWFQYLEKMVPNVRPLLLPDYREGLRRIVAAGDPAVERRNRFLDFLLALYAEKLDDASVWTLQPDDEQAAGSATRLLEAKLALLRRLVPVTHNRGRGIDALERLSRGNIAGMELKIRIQLGMDPIDVRPLSEVAGELGVQLVEHESEASAGRTLPRHRELIEEQFASVTPDDTGVSLPPCTIPQSLLASAGAIEELRIGRLPGDTAYAVVFRSAGESDWRLAGKHATRESAASMAGGFASLLRRLRRHAQQLYIVEHTLLRSSRFRREKGEAPFPYSFTATAVLSPPARLRRDKDYLRFAREVIRANTPAHVVIDDLFLGPLQMAEFERLYWAWRGALRQQDRVEIRRTSRALRVFLQNEEGNG